MANLLGFLPRLWRAVATGLSFAVFAVVAFLMGVGLLVVLMPLPLSAWRKTQWTRCSLRWAARAYIRMMWLLGLLTVDLRNADAFSGQGELFVVNHPSLLDMVLLLAVMPGPCCIVKAALARNPITYGVIKLAGYIPNAGDGEVLVQRAASALASGESLVIFPEGTRTMDPQQLQLRRGAANIALAARCRIRPVVIHVCPPTLRKNEPWYQVPATRPRFTLQALEAFDPDYNAMAPLTPGIQARQLTRRLHRVLAEKLELEPPYNR